MILLGSTTYNEKHNLLLENRIFHLQIGEVSTGAHSPYMARPPVPGPLPKHPGQPVMLHPAPRAVHVAPAMGVPPVVKPVVKPVAPVPAGAPVAPVALRHLAKMEGANLLI